MYARLAIRVRSALRQRRGQRITKTPLTETEGMYSGPSPRNYNSRTDVEKSTSFVPSCIQSLEKLNTHEGANAGEPILLGSHELYAGVHFG